MEALGKSKSDHSNKIGHQWKVTMEAMVCLFLDLVLLGFYFLQKGNERYFFPKKIKEKKKYDYNRDKN